MSFDIFVQDIPVDARSVEDITADFVPQPVGARSEVVAAIQKVAPEVKFSSPEWGTIDGEDYSIEINLGPDDPVMGFAFHVRGSERAFFLISDILNELDARAVAPGFDAGLFEVNRAGETFSRWRAYRDQVLKQR